MWVISHPNLTTPIFLDESHPIAELGRQAQSWITSLLVSRRHVLLELNSDGTLQIKILSLKQDLFVDGPHSSNHPEQLSHHHPPYILHEGDTIDLTPTKGEVQFKVTKSLPPRVAPENYNQIASLAPNTPTKKRSRESEEVMTEVKKGPSSFGSLPQFMMDIDNNIHESSHSKSPIPPSFVGPVDLPLGPPSKKRVIHSPAGRLGNDEDLRTLQQWIESRGISSSLAQLYSQQLAQNGVTNISAVRSLGVKEMKEAGILKSHIPRLIGPSFVSGVETPPSSSRTQPVKLVPTSPIAKKVSSSAQKLKTQVPDQKTTVSAPTQLQSATSSTTCSSSVLNVGLREDRKTRYSVADKLLEMACVCWARGHTRQSGLFHSAAKDGTTQSQSKQVSCFSSGVDQIICTGTFDQLEDIKRDPAVASAYALERLPGFSLTRALDLVFRHGITSVDDLRRRPELLEPSEMFGVKYADDFAHKIPCDEMQAIERVLRAVAGDMSVAVCGSYRRKERLCSDVDVILSDKACLSLAAAQSHLRSFVTRLVVKGFVIDSVSLGPCHALAACRIPRSPCARLLDLRIYPLESFHFAVLHFTGPTQYTAAIRVEASRLGLQLDEWGLRRAPESRTQPSGARDLRGVGVRSESEIFARLGLAYDLPSQRLTAPRRITQP